MSSMLTVEQINLDWLRSADLNSLKAAMRSGPDVLNAVNALISTDPEGRKIAYEMMNDDDYVPVSKRVPDPEEAAQIAADEAQAAQQAAEAESQAANLAAAATPAGAVAPAVDMAAQIARNAAEDTAAAAIGATITRNVNGDIEKIVVDYQVRGEDGRAIGRPTHFEARTWADLTAKVVSAHSNAVTYGERIKSNRHKQSMAAIETNERSSAAIATKAESERLAAEAVKEQDPIKMKAAIDKAAAAVIEAQSAEKAYAAHGQLIAETWCADHVTDFLPVQANINFIGEYMKANNLIMSYENLDKAFQAVKHQLSPVPTQAQQASSTVVPTSAVASTNPPPAAAVAPQSQPASITQADVDAAVERALKAQQAANTSAAPATAQSSAPVTANQPTVTRRPGVNGGLQPGSLSAARPVVQQDAQTTAETTAQLKREIAKMDPAIYRRKLADPKFVARCEAAGIHVLGRRS